MRTPFFNSSWKQEIRGKVTVFLKRKKLKNSTLAISSALLALEHQVLRFREGKNQKDFSRGFFGRSAADRNKLLKVSFLL